MLLIHGAGSMGSSGDGGDGGCSGDGGRFGECWAELLALSASGGVLASVLASFTGRSAVVCAGPTDSGGCGAVTPPVEAIAGGVFAMGAVVAAATGESGTALASLIPSCVVPAIGVPPPEVPTTCGTFTRTHLRSTSCKNSVSLLPFPSPWNVTLPAVAAPAAAPTDSREVPPSTRDESCAATPETRPVGVGSQASS